VFAADSDAVLAILGTLSGDAGLDLRWRLALHGMNRLFDDVGLAFGEKRYLARRMREAYGREFGIDGSFRARVSERYRAQRTDLEALLDPGAVPLVADGADPLAAGLESLRRRSVRLAPVTAELRRLGRAERLSSTLADIAGSYAHMHVNRVLRSAQRAQELLLYELLDRAYGAQAGRRSVQS
jgi:thiopeptide-type bacteriocin biosynthesis protein